MRVTYKITLHGIKDGENQSEVVERLMSLAKLPRYRVILLLTKPDTTVKRGLDARQAAMYEAVLDRAGCNVYRVPEPSSFSPPKEPSIAKTARSPSPHRPTTSGGTEPAAGLAKKKLARKAQMMTVGGMPFVVTT